MPYQHLEKKHPNEEKCNTIVNCSVQKITHDAFVAEVNKRGLSTNLVLDDILAKWVLSLRM